MFAAVAALSSASPAADAANAPPAEPAPSAAAPDAYAADRDAPEPKGRFPPPIAAPPRPGVGLEGYAGIALLAGAGDTRSRGLVGGLIRLRYDYFQVGGSIETTDSGQSDSLNEEVEESWHAYQGFAGVILPFERWIDVDASVGYAFRKFTNPDPIYGANGLDVGGSAVAFRFGISDRFGEKPLAARLGAALLGTIDLSSLSAVYERHYLDAGGAVATTRGTTHFGGMSFGLVVDGGFELGGGVKFRPND